MSYTLNLTSVQTCASFHLLMWNLGLSWVFQYTSMKLELHLWPIQSPNNQSPPGLPLITDPFGGFSGLSNLEEPRADPELTGGILYPIWPGNASGSPRRSWRGGLGREMSGFPSWTCCLCDPTSDKRKMMDGWIVPVSDFMCKHVNIYTHPCIHFFHSRYISSKWLYGLGKSTGRGVNNTPNDFS